MLFFVDIMCTLYVYNPIVGEGITGVDCANINLRREVCPHERGGFRDVQNILFRSLFSYS